ncbi:MAG: hypothetical protein Q9220_006913 [cf. Caloplaca sp. 1 TL-2023]
MSKHLKPSSVSAGPADTQQESLSETQQHELTMLRERYPDGAQPMEYICMFMNVKDGQNWTPQQMVKQWQKLKQENKYATIDRYHPLYTWLTQYDNAKKAPANSLRYRYLIDWLDSCFDRFHTIMDNMLDDSDAPSPHTSVENEANRSPSVLSSIRAEFADAARGPYTAFDRSANKVFQFQRWRFLDPALE